MADLPWSAFRQVAPGAFVTLSALWRHLSGEDLWSARAEGRRPWVCPTSATLAERTGRSLRAVERDIRRLKAAGWVARAWGRSTDGRRVNGLSLADPEGVDKGAVLAAVVDGTDESGGPTPTGVAGSDRKATSATPTDERAALPSSERPRLLLLTDRAVGAAADAADAPAHRQPRRSRTEQAVGGLECSAEALVGILGEVHLPAPAQRIVADVPTLRRARALLAVPLEGRDEVDALEARRERFQEVLAIAMDFAQICQVEPDQLRWWCGQMLELEGQRRGDGVVGVSRWEHVEHLVAMRRAGRADERGAGAQA